MSQEQTVYTKLRSMLLNGEFEPEQRLTEKHICDILEVSRTPVRAALLRLEAQNLVVGQSNRGYTVRGIRVRDVWDANVVRAVLEGSAAGALARQGLSDETRDTLEQSLREYGELAENVELTDRFLTLHSSANWTFHETLVSATGNESLTRSIETLAYMPVQINRTVFASDRAYAVQTVRSGLAEHHGVVAAILSGDATAAEMLMRTHSQKALRGIEAVRDRQKLGPDYLDMPFTQFIGGVGTSVAAA
ncbi:GntR family transcriptional regulator [Pseudodonghicola flavimaris]|uniref:GntR family transcriptional regulator n=1 Tax=Pseudodonghicola flavimaris TaxID=3050036 RepID=A0ABT7F582_9RHOB|nr:GntR family transcriptional regulator [Pseudodonghicola flavimaris]MDK3019762.1 GntR family transcriptional regulator [Pseudodonghicola flavimaris]